MKKLSHLFLVLSSLAWMQGCPGKEEATTTTTTQPKKQECVFRDDFCSVRVKTITDGKATEFGPVDVANHFNDANGEFNEIADQWCEVASGKVIPRAAEPGLRDGSYVHKTNTTSLKDLCHNAGVADCQLAEKTVIALTEDVLKKNTARFCKLETK